jgi:YD repeat-containing protein
VRVTSPNGRWLEFSYYAGSRRVYKRGQYRSDMDLRCDANENLTTVTDPLNHTTTYLYNATHQMTGVRPRNLEGTQTNLKTNEYTTAADAPTPVGWVKKQTHADGGVYLFAYTVSNGKSTQTDLTDPRGYVRRVTMNPAGYSDISLGIAMLAKLFRVCGDVTSGWMLRWSTPETGRVEIHMDMLGGRRHGQVNGKWYGEVIWKRSNRVRGYSHQCDPGCV